MGMKRRASAMIVAVGFLASSCGSAGDDATAVEESLPASQAGDEGQSVTEVEAVMVSTADGGELDFNSLRGQDVMLWFWAPW